MGRPTVVIELAADARFAKDLSAGGVFVPAPDLQVMDELDLVVQGGAGEVCLHARVVYVDPGKGAGLELVGFGAEIKEQLAQLAHERPDGPEASEGSEGSDEGDDASDGDELGRATRTGRIPRNAVERLRGLTLAQQIKVARGPSASERMALERLYGRNVWEALLHNPGLTVPEVARMARLGTLPRVLLELIVTNNTWLQVPEIRRALLANPRLGTDQIMRVLRLLPKHELKLAASIPAYPHAVRSIAKRMVDE